jgi:hypothetical protein
MSKINYAKRFLQNGIAVIPLRHRGKEPESAMMGGTWERYKTELPTEYQVACWLAIRLAKLRCGRWMGQSRHD